MTPYDWLMVSVIGFVVGWWAHSIAKRSESSVSIKYGDLEITAASADDVEEILQALMKYGIAFVTNEDSDDEDPHGGDTINGTP